MADFFAARVWEAGTLTGTDPTYTLPGTAMVLTGDALYRTFAASGIAVGATFTATVAATTTGGAWEQSRWTYTAANTIQRLAFGSSSTGAAVNWSGVTCAVQLDAPLPVSVSAGTASAGALAALGTNGQIDPSIAPGASYGPALSGAQFVINDTTWGSLTSATWAAGTLARFAMKWRYPFSPSLLGVMANTAVAGASCRMGVYPFLSTGEAGTLLFDTGVISPTVGSAPAFGASTFTGTLDQGTYIFDLLIGPTAPDLFVELATASGGQTFVLGFFGGAGGFYYQYQNLLWTQTGVTFGAMPSTAPAWSTFANVTGAYTTGTRPVIVAQR